MTSRPLTRDHGADFGHAHKVLGATYVVHVVTFHVRGLTLVMLLFVLHIGILDLSG